MKKLYWAIENNLYRINLEIYRLYKELIDLVLNQYAIAYLHHTITIVLHHTYTL